MKHTIKKIMNRTIRKPKFKKRTIRNSNMQNRESDLSRQTIAEITLVAILWTVIIIALEPSNRQAIAPLALPISLGGILYARQLLL